MQFNFDNSYLKLPSELYSECKPTPVHHPQLILFNHKLATELGINASTASIDETAEIFSGNKLPGGAASIAQAYSGHQFGHFTRLGDGRAILLGEQITPAGSRFDLQFKGSGVTPYSSRVMEQQIDLIVNWMRVGFIHGVMNTDNMTISGETIDYGPCAFMNAFKPETVFSSIDSGGRYAFGNQPQMALWNLTRLAESLLTLIDNDINIAIKKAELVLNAFQLIYEDQYSKMLGRKIGIIIRDENDKLLINKLTNWMYLNQADYTNTFVRLMYPELIEEKIFTQSSFAEWEQEWKNRLSRSEPSDPTPLELMQQNNPVYIPRNHRVEQVLNDVSESGELSTFETYVRQLSDPYATDNFDKSFMQPPAQSEEENYKTYCGT